MNVREFVLRFVGALIGVLIGEFATLPIFFQVYQDSPANRFPSFAESFLFFVLAAAIFVLATAAILGDRPFDTRTGAKVGVAYGLALGVMFALAFAIFTTKGLAYALSSIPTMFLNFAIGGTLGGWLCARYGRSAPAGTPTG